MSDDRWDQALTDAVADISCPPSGLLPGTGAYETWAKTAIARHFARHGISARSAIVPNCPNDEAIQVAHRALDKNIKTWSQSETIKMAQEILRLARAASENADTARSATLSEVHTSPAAASCKPDYKALYTALKVAISSRCCQALLVMEGK